MICCRKLMSKHRTYCTAFTDTEHQRHLCFWSIHGHFQRGVEMSCLFFFFFPFSFSSLTGIGCAGLVLCLWSNSPQRFSRYKHTYSIQTVLQKIGLVTKNKKWNLKLDLKCKGTCFYLFILFLLLLVFDYCLVMFTFIAIYIYIMQ